MLNNFIEAGEENNLPMLYWDIIDVCQYKCTYCFNMGLILNEEFKKGQHQQAWRLVLRKLQHLKFDFNISIQGGEPTLHPELHNIIKELEKLTHCKSIVISTNITAADDMYYQFDNPNSKVSIHLSYHPEYHRKIFDKIVRIVKNIKHIKIWVEVILYQKKEYYDQMKMFLESIKQTDIVLYVSAANSTQYWDNKKDLEFDSIFDPYIKQTKISSYKHITDKGKTVYLSEYDMLQSNINFQGWQCQALSYTIQVDGSIINKCTRQKLPLIIKELDVKKFVTCPNAEQCSCSEMFNYKKIKQC
jgi:molybdenum cofactor biosynthesis enzyme MoaA